MKSVVCSTLWLATATLQLLGCLPTTHGHGFLTAPKVKFFTAHEDPTAFSATIDGPKALPVPDGMHYGWGPSVSAEAFTAAFGNSSYKTLREFVMKHQTMESSTKIDRECGRTNGHAKVLQPLPDLVVWQHGDNEGFTLSHEGPCEVWCDNDRVFVEKNCAKTYPHVPAKLPYDRKKCQGKSRLQIVWLALHDGTRWQVYMNCAPLAGGLTSKNDITSNTSHASDPDTSASLTPTVLPGTVKPSSAQEETPTKAKPTKQPPASMTSKPSKTSSGSKTSKPSTTPKTKPPVDQESPAEVSVSGSDDNSAADVVDCETMETAEGDRGEEPKTPHGLSIPYWLTKPLQFISAQEAVEETPTSSRVLEEAAPTTQPAHGHDHSATMPDLGDSSAPLSETAMAASQRKTPAPTQLKPTPAPTTAVPTHSHALTNTQRPQLTHQDSHADGSDSDSDSSSDSVGCTTKKPFLFGGGRPGSPYYPAKPPGGVRPRTLIPPYVNHGYRDGRRLKAASPAPTPALSQQVINWQNGVQEVIDPNIAEKAKADFEAAEKKLEEWREKLKKDFGYA